MSYFWKMEIFFILFKLKNRKFMSSSRVSFMHGVWLFCFCHQQNMLSRWLFHWSDPLTVFFCWAENGFFLLLCFAWLVNSAQNLFCSFSSFSSTGDNVTYWMETGFFIHPASLPLRKGDVFIVCLFVLLVEMCETPPPPSKMQTRIQQHLIPYKRHDDRPLSPQKKWTEILVTFWLIDFEGGRANNWLIVTCNRNFLFCFFVFGKHYRFLNSNLIEFCRA